MLINSWSTLPVQLLPSATGPSAISSAACPRYTPMGEYTNNRAHSNALHGLWVHPEW